MENSLITFERMTDADVEAFLALEKRTSIPKIYNPTTTREDALDEIHDNELFFIVKGTEKIGTVSYQLQPESAYVSNMSVVPEYRGQGIARRAMEFVFDHVKDVPQIWLVTHPENKAALGLYLSLGFTEEKRVENYFGDGEPRLVLARE